MFNIKNTTHLFPKGLGCHKHVINEEVFCDFWLKKENIYKHSLLCHRKAECFTFDFAF